ncbi:WXG100 family type VII secretion target [Kibdelosporangium persicum]|uniref:ESAT-6-like protein n=1 Tax=Kibdelosporangium persicum TaxID=2698649 RepID=A0ABX2EZN9_9PSEU|nr:WXG100 family type VII secretion target [Kibdelosporangium persicum]NRN64521.1 WXG100 family type VII secretion target [Kibdelosporangium persicum]
MSGYVITPEMLQKASQDTANVRENSQAHIAQLRNNLAQLEGAWKGEASVAFHSLVQRFNTAAEKVLQDLQTISESLMTAAKNYGLQEEQASQAFKSQEGNFAF